MIKKTNSVINEIMSSSNSSFILLSKFDGEHVGFLYDLSNNYRDTFWLNCAYEKEVPLFYSIISKITNKDFMRKVDMFLYGGFAREKYYFALEEAFRQIEKEKNNCLLIIGNVDLKCNNENVSELSFLINKCPSNLKIIFTCESLPAIDFSKIESRVPVLLSEKDYEIQSDANFDFRLLNAEQIKIIYALSEKKYIEDKFATCFFDAKSDALRQILHRYKYSFFRAGDVFILSEKIKTYLENEYGKIFFDFDIDKILFQYYISCGKFLKAIELGLECENLDFVEEGTNLLLKEENGFVEWIIYILEKEKFPSFLQNSDSIFAKFFVLAEKFKQHNYSYILENGIDLADSQMSYPLKILLIRFIYAAFLYLGEEKKRVLFLRQAVSEKIEKNAFAELAPIMDLLEKENLFSDTVFLQIEKSLLDKNNFEKIWYSFVSEIFLTRYNRKGDYKNCKKHVQAIFDLIPFYIPLYGENLSIFVFSDFQKASLMADKIIDVGKTLNSDINIAEAHIIKAFVRIGNSQIDEAITSLNQAVSCAKEKSETFCRALVIKSCALAQSGKAEIGKDLVELYYRLSEEDGDISASGLFQTAIAYCYYEMGWNDLAAENAKRAYKKLKENSPYRYLAEAIRIHCEKDVYNSAILLEKLDKDGFDIIYIVFSKLFKSILNLCSAYSEKKYLLLRFSRFLKENEEKEHSEDLLKVNFFGGIGVYYNGKELAWKTKKSRELFYFYLLKGEKGVSRQEIINTFWSDYVYVSAINNLKTTNNIIRNVLARNNIPFTLEYINEKYVLKISVNENDYEFYQKMQLKANREKDINKKMRYALHLIKKFGEGFCSEISNVYFNAERNKIKNELTAVMIKLIRELNQINDSIEMNRFLSVYRKIVLPSEYNDLLMELGKK